MWLVEQMGGRSNTLEELVLHGPLDHKALERAWALLVARHPALQVTFHCEAMRTVVQRIEPRPAATAEHANLEHLPAEQRATECARIVTAARLHRFDSPAAAVLGHADSHRSSGTCPRPRTAAYPDRSLVRRYPVSRSGRALSCRAGGYGSGPTPLHWTTSITF